MPSFRHGEVEIAYLDEGAGAPIVMVHGFASTRRVNWVDPGWVATLTAARPPRHRPRQSRPRRLHQALRSGRLSQPPDGRGRARAARSSATSSAPTSWAIPWARASPPSSPDASRARARGVLGGLGIRLVTSVGLPVSIADALEAPSARRRRRPGRTHVPLRSPSRPVRPRARWLPASADRGRRSERRRGGAGSRPRAWSPSAPKTRSQGPRTSWRRCCRTAARSIFPDRDHMLAVGDKVFKAASSTFYIPSASGLSPASRAAISFRNFKSKAALRS